MFKKLPKILFIIFFLALLLRTLNLDSFPVGFHSDEARVAWNSLSILKTGQDDKGNSFSLYYDTFGDYRPTGIFYFTIPALVLFGNNEFAVRLPSALFGALTIFPLYLFVVEIFKYKERKNSTIGKRLGIFSSFLLAISPWHIEVSRATSEVVISTFFALFSLYFFVKFIKTKKRNYALLAIFTIVVSYLLYHAIRFLAPLFFITVFLFYFREVKLFKSKNLLWGVLIFIFVLSLFFSTTSEAKKRLSQVSIFNDTDITYEVNRLRQENNSPNLLNKALDNKYIVYTKNFVIEYSSYFSGDFLIGEGARPYRYTTSGAGILTFVEFLLFAVGILEIAKRKKNFLPLLLLLIAPLPAALTTEDAPNLHRAFLMVPFLLIIESYGLEFLIDISKKYREKITIFLFFAIVLNTSYFLYMYYAHGENHKPFIENYTLDGTFRNIGAKEAALELENQRGNYKKIIVTSFPDQLYPWYAFFTNKDPKEFNSFAIKRKDGEWYYQNILFSYRKCPTDDDFSRDLEKSLLVINPDPETCPYELQIEDGLKAEVVKKIQREDSSEVYVFLKKRS